MSTKTLPLFISNEDELYTYIGVIINDNGSFKNINKIVQTKGIKQHLVNNEKRRARYKLNKERKVKQDKELVQHIESIERNKFLKREELRLKSLEENYLQSELEDMESYI